MQRPDIELSTIRSTGPQEHPQPDGSIYRVSTPCFVCDGVIQAGEWISKVHGRWVHRDCAKGVIVTAEIRTAWALIGEDIARRPRDYTAKQIRTVVEHLAQLVHQQVLHDEHLRDDEMARPLSAEFNKTGIVAIHEADIALVRERNPIEAVVGAHVCLTKSAPGELAGRCPFHEEPELTFHVRPSLGTFHCYGCGEGGDVIAFVMKLYQESFIEAVEDLANRAGIGLTRGDGDRD